MKGMEKFLFYYSLLAITILFFTSVFFAPRPLNFISLVLLIPIIIYFWLKTTSPASTTPNFWSLRVVGVLLVLSILGIFSYSLGTTKQVPQKTENLDETKVKSDSDVITKELLSKIAALNEEDSNEEIAKELAEIRKELARISSRSANDTGIGGSTLGKVTDVEDISKTLESIPYGFVTIKEAGVDGIDVLDDPVFSASRVGIMRKDTNYEFFEKKDGWYLIKLPEGDQGWVNQRDVKEVYQ